MMMVFMQKEDILLAVCGVVLIFSSVMLLVSPTGYATQGTTSSNVTITKYLSIEMSNNLTGGIAFGSVTSLPAYDINASSNYDGTSSGSTYYVNVSLDSNTPVDFCILANAPLTDAAAGTVIGLANETYLNSSISNMGAPGPQSAQVNLTTTFAKASSPTGAGNSTFYRFWLDVPSATSSGTYNNTISIKGVETAQSC